MNKSGTSDLGFAKITMVSADHSSSCGMQGDCLFPGGAAAGWVIRLPQYGDLSLYHAGDTGVFMDMQLIDELYKPTHLLLPIGGNFTMGPEEAAFAVKRFFNHAHTVIPMHFGTFPLLPGTFEEFVMEMEKQGCFKKTVDSYSELLGKWMPLTV